MPTLSLAEIMQKFLAPPQQDYEQLAMELSKAQFSERLEKVVQAYFLIFANGYDFWQANYDYPRVHEFFYGASLAASDEIDHPTTPGDLGSVGSETLKAFFERTSLAFVHNTRCENAMLCNVPYDLLDGATQAQAYATEALEILDGIKPALTGGDAEVFGVIEMYLRMNLNLYEGYIRCAWIYLTPWLTDPLRIGEQPKYLEEAKLLLGSLQSQSRELFSELRTHLITSSRLAAHYKDRDCANLRVKQADVYLRATAYAGPRLTKGLFDYFEHGDGTDRQKAELLQQRLMETSGLNAEDVQAGGYLDDSFETELGAQLEDQIEFTFPAGDEGGIVLDTHDGERPIRQGTDAFSVKLSQRGTITVELALCVGECEPGQPSDASVSYMRVLNSLLAPHIGTLDFTWLSAPEETDQHPYLKPESVDFVLDYLKCRAWYQKTRGYKAIPKAETSQRDAIGDVLDRWEARLLDLTKTLSNPHFEDPYRIDPDNPHHVTYAVDYEPLLRTYNEVKAEFRQWAWLTADDCVTDGNTDVQRAIWEEGRTLLPLGTERHYIKLMDVCEEVLLRFKVFLEAMSDSASGETFDDWWFDRNLGWQAIVVTNRLALETFDGNHVTSIEPLAEAEQKAILNHEEFKGFIVSRHEVGGLDDWLFTAMPGDWRSLADIRSHDLDVVYASPNAAFLYMINNPQFLIDVMLANLQAVGDLRGIVLAYHENNRTALQQLKALLDAAPSADRNRLNAEQIALLDRLLLWRREITLLFELVRNLPISRYEDHTALFRAFIDASQISDWLNMLRESLVTFDGLIGFFETPRG